MIKANFRGHIIICTDGKNWTMENGSPVDYSIECKHCKENVNEQGHDKCISNLNGVRNACCGHGNNSEAYVQLNDGTTYYGDRAVAEIKKIKC